MAGGHSALRRHGAAQREVWRDGETKLTSGNELIFAYQRFPPGKRTELPMASSIGGKPAQNEGTVLDLSLGNARPQKKTTTTSIEPWECPPHKKNTPA